MTSLTDALRAFEAKKRKKKPDAEHCGPLSVDDIDKLVNMSSDDEAFGSFILRKKQHVIDVLDPNGQKTDHEIVNACKLLWKDMTPEQKEPYRARDDHRDDQIQKYKKLETWEPFVLDIIIKSAGAVDNSRTPSEKVALVREIMKAC